MLNNLAESALSFNLEPEATLEVEPASNSNIEVEYDVVSSNNESTFVTPGFSDVAAPYHNLDSELAACSNVESSNESEYRPCDKSSLTSLSNSDSSSNDGDDDMDESHPAAVESSPVPIDSSLTPIVSSPSVIEPSTSKEKPIRKRSMKGQGRAADWIIHKNQNLREKGQCYKGIDRKRKQAEYCISQDLQEL